MDNYIVINGKKAELTEEQLKALGIVTEKKNPFARQSRKTPIYYISNKGQVELGVEVQDFHCNGLYKAANYCTDRNLLQQRAYRETLSRLLWRYSMEHDGDKIDWKKNDEWKYCIMFENDKNMYCVDCYRYLNNGCVYFHTNAIAENAIKEIIEPFMKEHPDFVW
jgi:hypothetical protein